MNGRGVRGSHMRTRLVVRSAGRVASGIIPLPTAATGGHLRPFIPLLGLALIVSGLARDARAQCILANPSFEVAGSGGETFAGWNEFGVFGSSASPTHGHAAARVSGRNTGGWDVSAFWQPLDTSAGEQWTVSADVWHTSANPLTGDSRAIVNIEWRNAAGALISYESHTAADASTPTTDVQAFSVTSGPAPPGTATVRLLLGVLQSPTEPVPDVYYDQAAFHSLGPPSHDSLQWQDFPGGRTIAFSGRTWRVKGPGVYGPGPNQFCDSASCTWVDSSGRLHMTIQNVSGTWNSTEIVLEESLGYGDYIFTTMGRLDALHENVVLGMFLWEYGPCFEPQNGWWNPYNEIDIEFSRWGNPASDVAQFVAQPYDWPGNLSRFDAAFSDGELTSHAFRWLSDRVEYRSWRGGPHSESPATMIHEWTYAGPHIPRPEQPRVHVNMWQFTGPPGSYQEVVLDAFMFVPAGSVLVDVPAVTVPQHTGLLAARPNPFVSRTHVRYELARDARVRLGVYDMSGRCVRMLERGLQSAGVHEAIWDGRDASGRRAAPSVYLVRFEGAGRTASGRLVLLD